MSTTTQRPQRKHDKRVHNCSCGDYFYLISTECVCRELQYLTRRMLDLEETVSYWRNEALSRFTQEQLDQVRLSLPGKTS